MTANSGENSAANRVRMGRPGVAGQGRDRFGLSGTSQAFDPRIVAIRPDLADIAVAGTHFAPHYAAPMMMSGVLPAAVMRGAPSLDAEQTSLRRLINEGLGYRNFAAFLNERRIAAAKAALVDPARSRVAVSTVAFEVGFSSLAPFNRAFREVVGQTPTDWRRAQG